MNYYIMACGKGCLSCHLFFNFQSYQPTDLLIPWCHGNPSRWMIHEIANQLVSWSPQKMVKKCETLHVNCFSTSAINYLRKFARKSLSEVTPKKWIRTSKSAVCCVTISWVTKNNPLGANNPFTVQLVKKFLMCFIVSKHILRDFPNFDKVFYLRDFPKFFDTHSYQQFKKSWIPKVSTPETCWWNVGAS